MVAVKRICLEGLNEDEVNQLMREVDLVKSLSHPGIVKYEGMAKDEHTLSIVLEWVHGHFLDFTLTLVADTQKMDPLVRFSRHSVN